MEPSAQQSLFDQPVPTVQLDRVLLFGLGEFQARGHELSDRELALDRIRHAIDRACEKFGVLPLTDDVIASLFEELGATVVHIPDYFAKRPYRITVPPLLASEARNVYHQLNDGPA